MVAGDLKGRYPGLCRLSTMFTEDGSGGTIMKPFSYLRAERAHDAIGAMTRAPNSCFLGRATNLAHTMRPCFPKVPRGVQTRILLFVWIVTLAATARAESGTDLKQLVGEAVDNEIKSQTSEANDNRLWSYRKLTRKRDKERLWGYCETKLGIIHRLLSVNGRPLSGSQLQSEEQRISNLIASPDAVREAQKETTADGKEERNFLKLLPQAFYYQEEKHQANLVTLSFTPDPAFHPSGNEESVIHALQGKLVIDVKQKRLVSIRGRLLYEVKFWGGLAGHLDAGGTFSVESICVAPGDWELRTLDIEMKGKALVFKTISVQEHDIYSDYIQVPPNTTLVEAAERLKKGAGT